MDFELVRKLTEDELRQMNEERRAAEKLSPGFPWITLLFSLILGAATMFLFAVIIRTASPYIEVPAIVYAFYLPFLQRKHSSSYKSKVYNSNEAMEAIEKKYTALAKSRVELNR